MGRSEVLGTVGSQSALSRSLTRAFWKAWGNLLCCLITVVISPGTVCRRFELQHATRPTVLVRITNESTVR